jgi:hypothetical protein
MLKTTLNDDVDRSRENKTDKKASFLLPTLTLRDPNLKSAVFAAEQ